MMKCFADNGTGCEILKEKHCTECNFFQTKSMVELSRARTMRRIKKLPLNYQYSISEKYGLELK